MLCSILCSKPFHTLDNPLETLFLYVFPWLLYLYHIQGWVWFPKHFCISQYERDLFPGSGNALPKLLLSVAVRIRFRQCTPLDQILFFLATVHIKGTKFLLNWTTPSWLSLLLLQTPIPLSFAARKELDTRLPSATVASNIIWYIGALLQAFAEYLKLSIFCFFSEPFSWYLHFTS